MAISGIASAVLPLLGNILKATILKDKPNASKAADIAVDLALQGAMGVDRFNAFSKKVVNLPPGQDFTAEELDEYQRASQEASDRMDKVFAEMPDED